MKPTRREWVLGAAGSAAGCGQRLAKRFNGYAMVAHAGSRDISAVNLTRFRVERRIPLESPASDVLTWAATQRVLALSPAGAMVTEIDPQDLRVSRRKRLGAAAVTMLAGDDGRTLWVLLREPSELVGLDLKSWQVIATMRIREKASGFDLRRGVAALCFADSLGFADVRSGHFRQVDMRPPPGSVVFRVDGKQVLSGQPAARTITVADVETARRVVTLPLPFAPERFCTNHDGGQVFVTGRGMDAVAIVAPFQTSVSETILAGRDPGAMAVNETSLFVANRSAGDLTVITVEDRRVVAAIPVGQEPVAIALTPDGEYALVLNERSSDLAVIRLAKLTDYRYKRAPLFTVTPVGERPVAMSICRL